jgi:hypothetical protein
MDASVAQRSGTDTSTVLGYGAREPRASVDILRAISDNSGDKNARDLLVLSSAIIS